MNRIIVIAYFLLLISTNSNAQDPPNVSEILSLTPDWSHISVDPNWYATSNGNPNWTAYGGRFYIDDEIRGDNYYLLEASFSYYNQNYFDGFFLHKLNLSNGETEWIHRSNFFSGNDHIITSQNGDMNITDDEDIHVNGFKSMLLFNELPDSRVYFMNSMTQVIDGSSGDLEEEILDIDTSEVRKNFQSGTVIKSLSDGYKMKYLIDPVFDNGSVKSRLYSYVSNPEGLESTVPDFVYDYDTKVDFDVTGGIQFPAAFISINPNVGVAMFSSIDITVGGRVPTDITLIIVDTSDPEDIKLKSTIDATQFSPPGQRKTTGDPSISVIGDKIILGQAAKFENSETYIWIAMYDMEGNLIRHLERLSINGEDLDWMTPITSYDGEDYFLGNVRQNENNPSDKYYIFHYDDIDQPIVISEFTKKEGVQDLELQFNKVHLLPNFDMIVYNRITSTAQNSFKTYSYVSRFSANELGIITNADETELENQFGISPNPTSALLDLTGNVNDVTEVYISSLDGRQTKVNYNPTSKIDVRHLNTGMYILVIKTNEGRVVTKSFFKK